MMDRHEFIQMQIEEKIDELPFLKLALANLNTDWKELHDKIIEFIYEWSEQEYEDNKADYSDYLYECQVDENLLKDW